MPLTPEDVENAEFGVTRLRAGYEEKEVDDFLDRVAAELRRLQAEITQLQSSQQRVVFPPAETSASAVTGPGPGPATGDPASDDDIEAAATILAMAEQTATHTVAVARGKAADVLSRAQRASERLTADAQAEAEKVARDVLEQRQQALGDLQAQRRQLENRIAELQQFEREYQARLRALLDEPRPELAGRPAAAAIAAPGHGRESRNGGPAVSGRQAEGGGPGPDDPAAPPR